MITEEELIETIKDYPGFSYRVGFTDLIHKSKCLSIFYKSDVFCDGENRFADFYYNAKINNVLNGARTFYTIPVYIGDCVCLQSNPALRKTIKTKEAMYNLLGEFTTTLKQCKVKIKLKDLEKDFV